MPANIDGIECKPVPTKHSTQKNTNKKLYATIPLEWLTHLPGNSVKTKVIALLWCLGGMSSKEWFKFSNEFCKKFGVTSSQKNKVLTNLENSGHIVLNREIGRTTKVKLIKPIGWK